MKKHDHTMRPLPLLKGLRESQSLSQRALARKSGVAHDTIGQIERGERLARLSTTRKLAAALNVDPFMLTATFEELASLTEEELLDDVGATPEAIDTLRAYLIQVGFEEAHAEWEERKSATSYYDLLEDVDLAYKKLNPLAGDYSVADELVEMTEAALLLTRASARLVHFITSELEADDPIRVTSAPKKLGKLGRPLVDAWLEGAAATKRLLEKTGKPQWEAPDGWDITREDDIGDAAEAPQRKEADVSCPHCGGWDTRVIDTKKRKNLVWRQRECLSCGNRFRTYERPDLSFDAHPVRQAPSKDENEHSGERRWQHD